MVHNLEHNNGKVEQQVAKNLQKTQESGPQSYLSLNQEAVLQQCQLDTKQYEILTKFEMESNILKMLISLSYNMIFDSFVISYGKSIQSRIHLTHVHGRYNEIIDLWNRT